MSSVNKAIVVGNLGKDPEVHRAEGGGRMIVRFSVATSERWRDKNSGERKEATDWHNVVVFNENLAKVAEQYLKKGSKVYIEGAMKTRKWTDKNGVDRYSTDVVVSAFRGVLVLLDKSERSGAPPPDEDSYGSAKPSSNQSTKNDFDDEIPFE
jgi:single-strand DNA-binding protein